MQNVSMVIWVPTCSRHSGLWTLEDESWNLETTHCLPAWPQYLHLQWTFCSQIDHAIYKSELSTELSAVSSKLTPATLPAAHQKVRSYSKTVAVKLPDTLYHNLYNMLSLHNWAQNGATTNYRIPWKTSNLLKYLQGFKRTGLSFKRIKLNCCWFLIKLLLILLIKLLVI